MELTERIKGVVLTKVCRIKPDGDSTESKQITLKIRYDGLTLQDVFAKACRTDVISWQNGPGRRNYDKWTNGQVVTVDAKAPAKTEVDPVEAIINAANAAGLSVEEYLRQELAKRQGE